jgi:hypothetical protein
MRAGECRRRALTDLIDTTDRESDPEQLSGQLRHVATGDAIARGHAHDRGRKPRTEGRAADLLAQHRGGLCATARAAQAVRAVLGQDHARRRQLGDLVAPEAMRRNPLPRGELVPAPAAAVGIVIDDLIDLILRRELATRAAMTALPARLTQHLLGLHPRLRTALLTRRRRIRRRRLRTIARALTSLLLQLAHPLLKPRVRNAQLVKRPRQLENELHAALPARVVDRLRLAALHTPKIRPRYTRSLLWRPTTERLQEPAD